MIQHALNEYPNECCGILAGRGNRIERVYPVKNAHESEYTFYLDTNQQLQVEKEIDASGLELSGFYHSHTRTLPEPSRTDRAEAFYTDPLTRETKAHYPNAAYLIVSLRELDAPTIGAYRITDSDFAPEELAVV